MVYFPGKAASASSRNLWVSGLASTTRATDLKTLFSKYGKVSDINLTTLFDAEILLFIHVQYIYWNSVSFSCHDLLSLISTDIAGDSGERMSYTATV